jgi:hypothetical protein
MNPNVRTHRPPAMSLQTPPFAGPARSTDAVFAPAAPRQPSSHTTARDRAFVAMQRGLRASGGLARTDEVSRRLHAAAQRGEASLTELIVSGVVFSFYWHNSGWVPLFQFRPAVAAGPVGLSHVLAALAPLYDGWSLALWFSQPNTSLQMRRPADVLAGDGAAVLQAARCDRYVAVG